MYIGSNSQIIVWTSIQFNKFDHLISLFAVELKACSSNEQHALPVLEVHLYTFDVLMYKKK